MLEDDAENKNNVMKDSIEPENIPFPHWMINR